MSKALDIVRNLKHGYSYLLNNGRTIPALGFGTWSEEEGERGTVARVVKHAVEVGYRHIDCAPVYGNEAEIGKALKELFDAGTVKREDLFITSKLWNDAHKEKDVKVALNKTLGDLGLEYLDLYLIHWPVTNERIGDYPNKKSPLNYVPLSETWKALEALVKEGKVKSIGISNFNWQLTKDLLSYAEIKPQVNQVELHPLLTQEDLVKFHKENGILISAYAPLGGQHKSLGSNPVLGLESVQRIAKKHNKSVGQVLLRWSLQVGLNPLPKSSKKERIEENLRIFEFELDEAEVKEISAENRNQRFNNPTPETWGASWPAVFA